MRPASVLYDLTDIKGRFVVYAYLTSIGAFRGPSVFTVEKLKTRSARELDVRGNRSQRCYTSVIGH